MADELPTIDRALLSVLVNGAEKTFDNAEKLYFEADLLRKAGATARALCLHQISLEECSKVENLGAWIASILSGLPVNQDRVLAAFRRHSSKNKSNAYMLEGSEAEKEAKARGDWEVAREEFKKLQEEFHEQSNDAKNASLYVDWEDGKFVSPSEKVTKEMLTQITERNETFLGYAQNSLNMMKRLDHDPGELQDLVVAFIEKAKKLREEKPDNPMGAFSELVSWFLEEGLKRAKSRPT